MNNFIKVAAFSLAVIGLYTFYSVWIIPPINPGEPPEDAVAEEPATVDELVALGEYVYNGKGVCSLCHTAAAGRAPLLDRAAVVAQERIKDPGYHGKAADAEGYLYESLVEPSAYVVPGFGAVGSGDRVSPMPDVRSSAIGLKETEIRAVIAYLQSISGADVTVSPAVPTVKTGARE